MTNVFPANAKLAIGVQEPPSINNVSLFKRPNTAPSLSTLIPSGTPVGGRREAADKRRIY
jgi:hypothetical protein